MALCSINKLQQKKETDARRHSKTSTSNLPGFAFLSEVILSNEVERSRFIFITIHTCLHPRCHVSPLNTHKIPLNLNKHLYQVWNSAICDKSVVSLYPFYKYSIIQTFKNPHYSHLCPKDRNKNTLPDIFSNKSFLI